MAASASASASRSPLARSSSARPVAGPSHRSLVSPVKTAPGRIAGGQTGYSTTARGDPLRCSAVGCDHKLPVRQVGCDWCHVHCPGESCQSAAHQRHRSEPEQPWNMAGQQPQLQQQRWATAVRPIGGYSPHVQASKRVHAQPNPAYQPRLSATPTTAQPTMQAAMLTAAHAALQPTAQPTMQAAMRAVMQLGMQPGVQNSTSVAQRLAQVCLLQLLAQQQQQQGPR